MLLCSGKLERLWPFGLAVRGFRKEKGAWGVEARPIALAWTVIVRLPDGPSGVNGFF